MPLLKLCATYVIARSTLSPMHAPTNGGSIVTLSGSNLGVLDASVSTSVTMNGLPTVVVARGTVCCFCVPAIAVPECNHIRRWRRGG